MYVTELKIERARSINSFSIRLPPEQYAGWHVILGDNGAGKSTFVRALALALAGPNEAKALRYPFNSWLREGQDGPRIDLAVFAEPETDGLDGGGRRPQGNRLRGGVELVMEQAGFTSSVQVNPIAGSGSGGPLSRGPWGKGAGWFSASFGPYRRFTGGNRDYDRLFLTAPRLAPHLSAFGEDVALTECLEWLKELHVLDLEAIPDRSGDLTRGLLPHLTAFINGSGFLPHNTRLDKVTSQDISFIDGNNSIITVEQLSDGYRSVLSMTFELIRQLVRFYGADRVTRRIREGSMEIDLPGVVAIDEIDAHLHPAWQRKIGPWLLRVFPNMQFFVTTHSPIICQASTKGSVWRLPTPGTNELGAKVEGDALRRLIFGNILEAYDTTFFGEGIGRSEISRELLERLARLNRKDLKGTLTAEEKIERDDLRAALPTTSTVAQRTGLPVE